MDKMRKEFERWADAEGLFIDGGGTKGYPSLATQGAWAVWQYLYPEVERLRGESAELQRQLMAIRAGHTKTVEYDLSPAMQASAVRDKLIELGWTPPTKAKPEADND